MMKTRRIALLTFLVLIAGAFSLSAGTAEKVRSAGSDGPEGSRYVVTLRSEAADDLATVKQELAAIYGARLEIADSSDARQFVMTMLPARARLLGVDPRVRGVVEAPISAPVPAASPRHLTPHTTGYGDDGQSGTYAYDGSGNIIAIGMDTFQYDVQQRLTQAVIRGVTETYTYDAFGNRKSATGAVNCMGQTTCAQPVTVDSNTNRLMSVNSAAVTYDAAGNVRTVGAIGSTPAASYSYDGTGMMAEATVGTDDRQFIYTAADERIAVKQGVSWTWTVRDQSQKVLREFSSLESGGSNFAMDSTRWVWLKDYVWRDGLLLATTTSTGTLHYHLDHLGTPRLVTDSAGVKVAEHAYYPFGAEIALTPHENPEEAMKFTGHERDIVPGEGQTLDYMHARYSNASVGRFLSVDPIDGYPANPQSWNRYSYVLGNPVNLEDPTGMESSPITCNDSGCSGSITVTPEPGPPTPKLPTTPAPPPFWVRWQDSSIFAAARSVQIFYSNHKESIDNTLLLSGTVLQILGRSETGPSDETMEELEEAIEDLGPINPNDLNHVFGDVGHNLEAAATRFGGPERLYKLVQIVLEKNGGKLQVAANGNYSALIRFGTVGITVTGRVVGGVPRIGTFYIP
jgi:RHS repeat-associated protein